MERIFANLYRCSSAANKKQITHTYFLQRGEGNLLICHQTAPSLEDIAEIDELGGIGSQWVCHQHDLVRDGLHEDLYARFGCMLYHHRADAKGVRKKTKCPEVQYGDDGLEHGSDFEALYFPCCSDGFTVYRWRHRGKYFLISSHALGMHDGKWEVHFPYPTYRKDLLRPQIAKLAKLRVDYVLPGYTAPDGDEYYRLNDRTRKSFSERLKELAEAGAE